MKPGCARQSYDSGLLKCAPADDGELVALFKGRPWRSSDQPAGSN